MTEKGIREFAIRVPASTSNLGAGFDCFGLALRLYVTVRAEVLKSGPACRVESSGECAGLANDENNLIYRAMSFVAEREGWALPPVRLEVYNEIPLSGGLGSSAAAIVAGLLLAGAACGRKLSADKALRYATEMEGHPDNAAASLRGGFVVNATDEGGAVTSIKMDWPDELKIVAASPHMELPTKQARAVLPKRYSRAEAIFNLQRATLFAAAVAARDYAALREATRDCWHQKYRAPLVPGLSEALSLPQLPGLCGLFLSGAGPTVLALARDDFAVISEALNACFARHNLAATTRILTVDTRGAHFL
jgi:homoserine kinase